MSFAARLRYRVGSLDWRLTLFYASVLAVLLLAVGLYLDNQLSSLATAQLQDRLEARSPGPRQPAARTGLLPPPLSLEPPSAVELATIAARTDRAGVTTTILDSGGQAIAPDQPPSDWHAQGDLSAVLFQRAASTSQQSGPVTVATGEGRYLVLDRGVALAGGEAAVIQTSVPLTDVEALLRSFRIAYGIGVLGALVLAVGAGQPLARMALRPLRSLATALANVPPSGPIRSLPVPKSEDELKQLAVAFNHMLAEIDVRMQAEQRGREQLRRFVGDASHELRSPLTSLSGYVDLLLESADGARDPHMAARMRREVDRMSRLVQDLLALTRLDAAPDRPAQSEEVDLGSLAADIVAACSAAADTRDVQLEVPDDDVLVVGDSFGLERVLENLIQNAIQHTAPDGHVTVRIDTDGGWARLAVCDDGEGIPPEHQARIFDRFYRVDPARARDRGNAGLGLAIAKAIVAQHSGRLSVESQPGAGSTFTVRLPLA